LKKSCQINKLRSELSVISSFKHGEKTRMKHPLLVALVGSALSSALITSTAVAQFVTTPAQKATAQRVAQAGVALDELSPNAPDSHTVKRGDTLWAISGLFLKRPWRWPELWGMNLQEIRNPHLIYPGQVLTLDKSSGRAILRAGSGGDTGLQTIRVSPRTRYSNLADAAIPTLSSQLLEPFLAEPALVDEASHNNAPRLIGSADERVVFARGDRVYARAARPEDLAATPTSPTRFRVYRNAVALKDPSTGQILAYEAQYVGEADLIRGEGTREVPGKDGKLVTEIVPATFDIISSKEEMRAGDRLLPEAKREFLTYAPRAPGKVIEGTRVMSIHGSAVARAGQNMVVTLNRGASDGLEVGHVLAIQKDGLLIADRTDPVRTEVKLPDERNGLAMVFKTYDKVAYALILNINDGVKVGDRLINPR
jgi:LysM domain